MEYGSSKWKPTNKGWKLVYKLPLFTVCDYIIPT
jgi:hypothetical protein